jgi:hypothetical protein
MNDDELRAMIREAIARHLGPTAEDDGSPDPDRSAKAFALPLTGAERARSATALAESASRLQFPLERGGDGDGACLIEPSVRCNHCGYCLCYGH